MISLLCMYVHCRCSLPPSHPTPLPSARCQSTGHNVPGDTHAQAGRDTWALMQVILQPHDYQCDHYGWLRRKQASNHPHGVVRPTTSLFSSLSRARESRQMDRLAG
jgi:hypothetical protein